MNAPALLKSLSRLLGRIDGDRKAALRRSRTGVHDLRVDLKRLRAFARLVARLRPEYDARREGAGFRRLFKAAAGLRDLHIVQDAARDALSRLGPGLSAWIVELKLREPTARRVFTKAASRRGAARDRGFERRVAAALSGVPAGDLSRRAEDVRLAGIRSLAGRRPFDVRVKSLHRLRIEAKELRYTLEILDEASERPGVGSRVVPGLKSVHQALGRWHDTEVVLAAFRAFAARGRSGVPALLRDAFVRDLEIRAVDALVDFQIGWKRLHPAMRAAMRADLTIPGRPARKPRAKRPIPAGSQPGSSEAGDEARRDAGEERRAR